MLEHLRANAHEFRVGFRFSGANLRGEFVLEAVPICGHSGAFHSNPGIWHTSEHLFIPAIATCLLAARDQERDLMGRRRKERGAERFAYASDALPLGRDS
jgi:hypothetical protein